MFKFWDRRRDPLSKLERLLLRELAARLPRGAGEILERQIASVNYVQRHANGKEVNLYSMHRGKSRPPVDLAFPNRKAEAELARLDVSVSSSPRGLSVSFWLVNGVLFSIGFAMSPPEIREGDDIVVRRFQLLADPMIPAASVVSKQRPIALSDPNWAGICASFGPCSGAEPSPDRQRQAQLEQIRAVLPSDYLALLRESDGLQSPQFEIRGADALATVYLEDANYIVLADLTGVGVIGVLEGGTSPELRFFSFETERTESVGEKLTSAISSRLGR